MSGHIAIAQLALYSRGDLGFWSRRNAEAHVSECEECSRTVREFRQAQESMRSEAEQLPLEMDGVDWQALSREMTANIRLGLAAGECIAKKPVFQRRPRLTLAMAGCAALLVFAGIEKPSSRFGMPIASSLQAETDPTTLEGSGSGIAIRTAGHVLTVPAPRDRDVIRTVDSGGEIRSRYIDDTGAVTIVNVYAE